MGRRDAAAGGSALPRAVLDCLPAAGPGFRAALKKDPLAFPALISRLLSGAAEALGCAPEETLFLTGFGRNDPTPGRLEAALAELSAVLFLRAEGFSRIRPLERAAWPTADLLAERGVVPWAFEVRWVRDAGAVGAAKRLAAKCRRKSAQVATSLKKSSALRGGIVLVAGQPAPGPFTRSPGLDAAAGAARSLAGLTGHVCLVSGEIAGVFPPWPDFGT